MMIRLLDFLLSLIVLVIIAPIFLVIILILKLTGEGEVFYIQQRVGYGHKLFGLFKFATMVKDSPNIGAGEITVKNDPRVLPFGKFLRKTKLNELPQLINILLGHMSIVGPRPMVPNTFSHYPEVDREKLSSIRPGLTGIGSIIFRDEESYLANKEEPMSFYIEHIIPYKSSLEIWYFENRSIWLNIKIIIATAWVIVFPSSNISKKLFKGLPNLPKILT